MTRETEQSIGTAVDKDPEEVRFGQEVDSWVRGEIEYEQVMQHYPSHDLSIESRIARSVKNKVSQLRNAIREILNQEKVE